MIFIQWVIPLVDGIINLFLTKIEVWKSYMTVKIANCQNKISQLKGQLEESNASAIGFTIREENEEDYET